MRSQNRPPGENEPCAGPRRRRAQGMKYGPLWNKLAGSLTAKVISRLASVAIDRDTRSAFGVNGPSDRTFVGSSRETATSRYPLWNRCFLTGDAQRSRLTGRGIWGATSDRI